LATMKSVAGEGAAVLVERVPSVEAEAEAAEKTVECSAGGAYCTAPNTI
jgi:hypothetical protein